MLYPILRGLADTFVSERSSPVTMSAVINAIRAICARVPLAILDEENENLPTEEQEAPLLLDLVQYKSSKDQGVTMAARSLISLYREVNPSLLLKKHRGKVAAMAVSDGTANRAKAYGEHLYATGVEGVELLQEKSSGEEEDDDDDDGEEENEKEGDVDNEEIQCEEDTGQSIRQGEVEGGSDAEKGEKIENQGDAGQDNQEIEKEAEEEDIMEGESGTKKKIDELMI